MEIHESVPRGVTDAELIVRARTGDTDAWADLYERHRRPARGLAVTLGGHSDADDLVSVAFASTFDVMRRGGGPDYAFRPYVLKAVRNAYVSHVRTDSRFVWTDDEDRLTNAADVPDPTEALAESTVLATAFSSLPERWQAVLWHGAVEGESTTELADRFDMTNNSVAALTYRAREGLRQAYLAQHVAVTEDAICREIRSLIPGFHRDSLSPTREAEVRAHLDTCEACSAVVAELGEIMSTRLGALLVPALLGLGLDQYTAGSGQPGGPGAGPAAVLSATATGLRTVLKAVAAVSAACIVIAGAVVVLNRTDRPIAANAPHTDVSIPSSQEPPVQDGEESREPQPEPSSEVDLADPGPTRSALPTDRVTSRSRPKPDVPAPAPTDGGPTGNGAGLRMPPPAPEVDTSIGPVEVYPMPSGATMLSMPITSSAPSTSMTLSIPTMTAATPSIADNHGTTCGPVVEASVVCTVNQPLSADEPVLVDVTTTAWSGGQVAVSSPGTVDPDPQNSSTELPPALPESPQPI